MWQTGHAVTMAWAPEFLTLFSLELAILRLDFISSQKRHAAAHGLVEIAETACAGGFNQAINLLGTTGSSNPAHAEAAKDDNRSARRYEALPENE